MPEVLIFFVDADAADDIATMTPPPSRLSLSIIARSSDHRCRSYRYYLFSLFLF